MNKIVQKYHDLSLPLKATFWFTICNFILKGISFITVPLFTRLLSTTEYGTVSIYNSYQQIFLIFATLELLLGAYQRGILKYKGRVKQFTISLQLLVTFITLVLFIITFIFRDIFIQLTDTSVIILVLMFMYFPVHAAYDCWLNRKRFDYNYKPAVIATLLFTIISTGGSLIAVICINQTANVRIVSMLLLEIVFCLPFYLQNISIKKLKKNEIKGFWEFSLAFQLPLVLHSLSYLILAQADRIMIGAMVGKSEAAIYSVAYSLANVIIIFQTSLNQVLKPWRYQRLENHDYNSINKNTNLVLLFIGIVVLMFILVAPEIMKILFSASYYEAIWTIPPISLSVFFMFLYSVFTDVESYYSKTKYVMYASVICAITNIILNYIGIHLFGYISCGYATLISYILFAILHYIFMKKVCIKERIESSIFNIKFIAILSVLMICLVAVIIVLYQFTLIRYLILIAILIGLLINRDFVVGFFKNIR